MKCALILLSLVAFAYAVPITFGEGKNVIIDEDGTITITGNSGKKIVISKAIGYPGPKDIEISVGGPNGPVKKIHFDEESKVKTVDLLGLDDYNFPDEDRDKRASVKDVKGSKSSKEKEVKDSKNTKDSKDSKKTQSDILSDIFKAYQGVVDVKSYNDLLTKIDSLVQKGDLNPAVYSILRSLDDFKLFEKYGNQVPYTGYPDQSVGQYQYPKQYPDFKLFEKYGNQVPYTGYPDQSVGQYPYSKQYPVYGQYPQYPVFRQYPIYGEYPYYNQAYGSYDDFSGVRDTYRQVPEEQASQTVPEESTTVSPWKSYWQSIIQQKQAFVNPWITLKRPVPLIPGSPVNPVPVQQ